MSTLEYDGYQLMLDNTSLMVAGTAACFVMGNVHPEAGRQDRQKALQPGERSSFNGAPKLGPEQEDSKDRVSSAYCCSQNSSGYGFSTRVSVGEIQLPKTKKLKQRPPCF